MKFLKILLPLTVALLMVECGPSGNSFIIEGEFTGMKAGELYLFNPAATESRLDTLKIADYKFRYEGETEDTVPYVLLFPNAVEHVIFVSPATTVKYTAATNDLKNYRVTGTQENDLMNQFRQASSNQKESDIPYIAKSFIGENPSSPVALYLFDRYFVQQESADGKEAKALLNILKTHHPGSRQLIMAESMLKNESILTVGASVPDVSLKQQRREDRQLWSGEQKDYTLLFFWATWMPSSYDFMWRVRQLKESNADKVRFVGISLDGERYRWEDQTRRDSLLIEHYCDGLSWSSPLVQHFGLDAVPFYAITDRTHKVLVTGSSVEQMAKDITKYVK